MAFEFSSKERVIKVVNLDQLTNEYVGEGDAHIAPMTGLPAYTTTIKPPRKKDKKARVFNEAEQKWYYFDDFRGTTVYNKETGFEYIISELGPIPDTMTTIAPISTYCKWDGSAWVVDEAATVQAGIATNEQKKSALFDAAARQMLPLQNAVKHEIATDEEISLLSEWEKYTVLLNRVDVTSSDIVWPAAPAI